MSYIAATPEYGLIIRKPALSEKSISYSSLLDAMDGVLIIDESDDLISFGPMFGEEALSAIKSRLSNINLDFVDDYFELNFLMPDWVKLGVASATFAA